MLTEEQRKEIREEMGRFPDAQSALLGALRIAQSEKGYVDNDSLVEIADLFSLSPAEVYGVASFYQMIRQEPVGTWHIQFCTNVSCSLAGAPRILEHLKSLLAISEGEVTPDGLFSLECVQCLGACGSAPVMMVNDELHERLDEEKISGIIGYLKKRGTPHE
ncbi:MAG: NADH-quinone oxidoreductase subunit NuoE [Candidatus Eremiobacteraeota bacterium]|nr:NADH-quinone oxidoreductase subunit NuoE [Candidatus Eremiobacteraeota bacterium]